MERKKLLIGLILFLVITNLVTVVTVLVRTRDTALTTPAGTQLPANEENDPGDRQRTLFFTRELKLDGDQQDRFREIHQDYMRKARNISQDMGRLRDQLLQEMDRANPDRTVTDSLSEQIGHLHTELKKLTVNYYLGLKAACNPSQQQKLYEIMKKIINPEGDVQLPREGGRYGGPGRGRGPWWKNQNDSTTN
jgi:Spy/CpxP family protein refolding chaperone